MSGFKLLAIRVLKNCDSSYRKVLKEDTLYPFYKDYNFIYENNEVVNIVDESTMPENFYKVKGNDQLKISISAVVGKNGSGKSSLMDMFYFFCYALSVNHNIIEIANVDEINFSGFNCEFFYKTNEGYFNYKINDSKFESYILKGGAWEVEMINFNSFFYSIALNYSLYGLNSDGSSWYRSLFHKNDGYQTPIVINPYRNNGIIDVNSELHLSQSRTLLNLSLSKEDYPIVVNEKRISSIDFTMDFAKNDIITVTNYTEYFFWNVVDKCKTTLDIGFLDLFNMIAKEVIGYEMSIEESNKFKSSLERDKKNIPNKVYYFENVGTGNSVDYNEVKFQLVKYVINKFFKICLSNPLEYDFFVKHEESEELFPVFIDIKGAIVKLNSDKSHITLKLRQALYSIKGDYYSSIKKFERLVDVDDEDKMSSYRFSFPWNRVKKIILDSLKKNLKESDAKLEVVPSAFVKPILKIQGDNLYDYKYLSSGEQQLSNTLHTISYHLNNINSVHYSSSSYKKKYPYVNILLDEIELYFHPDFQRKFISNLLEMLSTLDIDKIDSINFTFFTHSPFILSDIPTSNILRMSEGKPESFKGSEKTFGANIHELLTHSFFMESTTGEYAQKKIKEIVDFHYRLKSSLNKNTKGLFLKEYKNKQKEFHFILNNIGEDVIGGILENHISFIKDKLLIDDKEKKIKKLQEEIDLKLKEIQKLK